MRKTIWLPWALMLWLGPAALPAAAQLPGPGLTDIQPPPPPPEEEAAPATVEPTWDPLRASKSIEVGTFYMKKGNYEAAIDRFEDAASFQPGLAKPFLLLGETYDKKKDPAKAAAAYRKYLDLNRNAPDRDKIRKHIEELEREIARSAPPPGSG
jgi:tetratricopeptide (TPR) repeat protein